VTGLVVGLTGGIGSGKTAASDEFGRLGATVIDTDLISRELTAAGGAAIEPIRAAFGDAAIDADGALDRARMRAAVFADPVQRGRLEAILHPRIDAEVRRRLAAAPAEPYTVLVVPLLHAGSAYLPLMARILVVDCPEELQVARVVERSGLRPEEVRAIIAAQPPRAARLAMADDVVRNDGDLAALAAAVRGLHQSYSALAGGRGDPGGAPADARPGGCRSTPASTDGS
jgi:dephospho-CoA kinase